MPLLEAVPWIGQWGANANAYRADCGPACIAMLLAYYGKLGNFTVDQLARETSLASGASGLMPGQLVTLAARHGLPTCTRTATLTSLRYEIDRGRPVCILVAYRFINNRLDIGDNVPGKDGHFLNIIGYDDDHFVANDPDYWVPYTERGHDTDIAITDLQRAMAEYQYQVVFVEVSKMSLGDQINALVLQTEILIENVEGNLAQIKALAAQISDEPPEPPAPVPQVAIVINATGANIRQGPTINSKIMLAVKVNTKLTVLDTGIDADNHRWMQVTVGPEGTVNGFVAKDLLSFP